MGKKQHQKDKMYITSNEWKHVYGGYKGGVKYDPDKAEFRRLPFFCCSLTLQPAEDPYCTPEGNVFDLLAIVPYLRKYGHNPVTGEPLSAKMLFKLNFHKNASDEFHCPVTFKTFTPNTHIVAIKTSGNVYCSEAVEKLNIVPKNYKDLMTDEPFVRNDVIDIQNPENLDKFNMTKFYHLKKDLKVLNEEEERAKKDPQYTLKSVNTTTKDILDELKKEYKVPEKKAKEDEETKDRFNSAHYSTGAVAAGFTSTVMMPEIKQEAAIIDNDIVRYDYVKKKGYIRLYTNKGNLNLELYCQAVPKACENFMKLCEKGYYNGTVFHRSIKHFMIQGGDPEGTGKGGQSHWGEPFKDEFRPNLTHTGRGVLSMANSGPNTNKSQFFITYRSCRHLDNKHSVFGKVVGGIDTLSIMEKIPTDKEDKPTEEIKLIKCDIFVNPFDEADEQLAKEREEDTKRKAEETASYKEFRLPHKAVKEDSNKPKKLREGVGKYLDFSKSQKSNTTPEDRTIEVPAKKKSKARETFDFSSW